MRTLEAITIEDTQVWCNCYDPVWTNLFDEHEVDITDANTWALLLRNEYCKDVREYKHSEFVYDAPYFVASGAESGTCMQDSNIIKIINQIYSNMGSYAYYGNYNGWLKQRSDDAKAQRLSFTCEMTSKYYHMLAEKGKTEKD